MAAIVPFSQVFKFLQQFSAGPALDILYQFADRQMRRYRCYEMDMFGAHMALDYFHTLLLTDLFYHIPEFDADIAS